MNKQIEEFKKSVFFTFEIDFKYIIFNIINIIIFFIYINSFVDNSKYIIAGTITFYELQKPLLLINLFLFVNNIISYKLFYKYKTNEIFKKIFLYSICNVVINGFISYYVCDFLRWNDKYLINCCIYYPIIINILFTLIYTINILGVKKFKISLIFSFVYSLIIIIYIILNYYISKTISGYKTSFYEKDTINSFMCIFLWFFINCILSIILLKLYGSYLQVLNIIKKIFKNYLYVLNNKYLITFVVIIVISFLTIHIYLKNNKTVESQYDELRRNYISINYRKKINEADVFDVVKFGRAYENGKVVNDDNYYLVLNKEDNILTLYSLYPNGSIYGSDLKNSSYDINTYLNKDFYKNSFNSKEKKMIIKKDGKFVRLIKSTELEYFYKYNEKKNELNNDIIDLDNFYYYDSVIEKSRLKPNVLRTFRYNRFCYINEEYLKNLTDKFKIDYNVLIEIDINKYKD